MSNFENQVNSDRRLMGIPIIGNPSAVNTTLRFDNTLNAFVWQPAGGVTTTKQIAIKTTTDIINPAAFTQVSQIQLVMPNTTGLAFVFALVNVLTGAANTTVSYRFVDGATNKNANRVFIPVAGQKTVLAMGLVVECTGQTVKIEVKTDIQISVQGTGAAADSESHIQSLEIS